MVALNGYLGYFAFLDRSKELAVSGLEAGSLRLVKHVEKENHHQADYQPESQIFIKRTQLESLLTNNFNAAGPISADFTGRLI